MRTLKTVTNSKLKATALSENTLGQVVIDKSSALTRLNYFDGKFLRAPDLQQEQAALLSQVRLASQAAGGGVVHGFNCTLAGGDKISISPGLAYDRQGRVLVLSQSIDLAIGDLIAASQTVVREAKNSASDSSHSEFTDGEIRADGLSEEDNTPATSETYLIVVNHIEAYCGEEDVYGKLCSEACINSTQRTHIVEGIQITAIALNLTEALKSSEAVSLIQKHLRSRVSSAFFAQEQGTIASLITEQGLNANTWCLGAESLTGQGIPIALVSRAGATTVFLDAWSVRRERMETPPQLYWAGRMAMRPWNVFLAQILQFQCQLSELLKKNFPQSVDIEGGSKAIEALLNTAEKLESCMAANSSDSDAQLSSEIVEMKASIHKEIQKLEAATLIPSEGFLIDGGIIELPSAGYLPIMPNNSVNEQVRHLMGQGVDLRFCVVRSDFVPHALEEAQHMERISLLKGLDHPDEKPQVDILVPDGQNWVFFHRRRKKACSDIFEAVRNGRIVFKMSCDQLLTHEYLDIKFDSTDQIVGGELSDPESESGRWLKANVVLNHEYTIYLINKLSNKSGLPQQRIDEVRHALVTVLTSLKLDIAPGVVIPTEAQTRFGKNVADAILAHLDEPSVVHDLFLIELRAKTPPVRQVSCWERIFGRC